MLDKSGRIFVIERSGLIVGTSSNERTFTSVNGKPQRLNILNSSDALSRNTARYLVNEFGSFDAISEEEHLEPILEQEKQFIQVKSWRDRE